jgi:rubrerythrin
MVDKAENTQIRLLLDEILQQTKTHRELLKHLSRALGNNSTPSTTECESQMGQLFMQSLASASSIKKEVSRGMPILEAARQLLKFEDNVSEEYLTRIHAGIRALSEANPAVKRILADIADDERRHAEILQLMVDIGSNQ